MPLVKAQCTSCGAALEVDESKDAAVCPFCNMPYVIEKAINQYKINNTFHIEKAVFESEDSEAKLLKRGIAQLEMREYEDACVTFKRMTKLYPEEYRGWLGLVLADSELNTGCEESAQIARYRENTLYQCPEGEKSKLGNMYISSQQKIEYLTEQIRENEELINSKNADIKEYEDKLAYYYKCDEQNAMIRNISLIGRIFSPVFIIICMILCIKTRIYAFFYIGLVCFGICIVSFLAFRQVSAKDDFERAETETAGLRDEAKSLIGDAQKRIDSLKSYLEEAKKGESLKYYLDLLKV
ncbi:MAG: hypothetical protein J6X66_11550 [Lachnospiraceae bacterium]|nr:hypothetical protein [Lachnospiraceae bacterium]